MPLSDFDFILPEERIAQRPLPRREEARMMVVERSTGGIRHSRVDLLPEELSTGDVLVINDSRVFPARLYGELDSGRKVEALFIRAVEREEWMVLLRPSKKVRPGSRLRFPAASLEGEVLRRGGEGEWVVRFAFSEEVERILERHGEVPLPPYIRRPPTDEDRERYQTVFADVSGSVAAPTAGLHFTEDLLGELRKKEVAVAAVTLHVGPGTFRPIRTERIEDHRLEEERYSIPDETAAKIASAHAAGGRVVAVGTTVVRTLETAASGDGVRPGSGSTGLYLYPPYQAKVVDAMVTNFHLPRSTLFLLVCALAGTETMKAAYEEAVREGYRFYSYGDCMLLL